MLRLICGAWLSLSVGVLGCGEGTTGTDGTGGTIMLEPGPGCIAFCDKVVGECEVAGLDNAVCKQSCEEDLARAGLTSEACRDAVEEALTCATDLECQHIYDRFNEVNLETYPCLPALENTDVICTQ